MARVSIIILLLAALMAQTFNRAAIIFDYYVNPAAFAKNCENKAKPQLHCKGKCQMMKKLKQEEKKDEQNPDRKQENKHEVICHHRFANLPNQLSSLAAITEASFRTGYPVDRSYAIFHPPSLA